MDIVIPYQPRPLQARLHASVARFSVLVCHRRFGKTVFGINHLMERGIDRFNRGFQRPQVAYLAPTYGQAKRVAWDFAKYYSAPLNPKVYETELRLELPGGIRMMLLGADNPDSLRGIYLDAVVLDEYADMNSRVYAEVIRPALADREGEALWIGTPKGLNAFHEVYQLALERVRAGDRSWFAALHKASETGIIPSSELAQLRATMSEEQYAQELECDFGAAVSGAYFAKLVAEARGEGRITSVPYAAERRVHTAWDLGVGDGCAIWFFQKRGRVIDVIDCLEANGVGLPWYAKELDKKPYLYGRHFAPHDISVTELGTGASRLETARSLGIRFTPLPKLPLEDGIEQARLLLRRCVFDAAKCEPGLKALAQYHQQYDDRRKVFLPKPFHDWSSHYADAFRYLAQGEERADDFPSVPRRDTADGTDWNPIA